ncbi:SusC/RagA family TonB-linked outer membrane protein [Aureibaculum luteum]|uniref:SusC/RagA family TonB-linked outer membrane protein n=1 Tax=Aureibaculum luteum TaxID=1548456 RepID=UPI000E556758|nr:SusC/RagA family TonB-linked outer membrane protein [Aureibaculum luteum]
MKFKFYNLLLVFSVLCGSLLHAQERTINGTVSDESGPLPGVSVVIKGTTSGTETDFDGIYTIKAKAGDVLKFSFIGMTTKEVTVGASSTMNVVLEADNVLDEVVVTGLGLRREKKSLGYSQQSVDAEQLQKGKDIDVNNALAGKVAGVQIVGQASTGFRDSEIKLRGETDVLYVVDGIQVYETGDINTNDIADMSVLKGASATAIYGPEGRNGVIIITTKKGTNGKATFTVDHSTIVGNVSIVPDYQNEYGGGYSQTFNTFTYDPATDPADWASFDGQNIPEYNADESWGPKLDGTLVRHWDSWVQGTPEFGELRGWSPTPNDVDSFYRTSITNNTSLSFSKGGDGYNIRSAISLIDKGGIIRNSDQKTINMSLNASYDISDKFTVNVNVNYQDRKTTNDPDQGYANLASNMNQWWQRQLDFDRLRDYERNGQIVSWNIRSARDARPLYWDMPDFQSFENLRHEYKNSAYGKIGGTYKFNDQFNIIAEVRSTFHNYANDDRGTTKSLLEAASYSEYQRRYNKEHYFSMLNYNNSFLDGTLDVAASLGGEIINQDFKGLAASTNGDLTIPEFYSLAGSKDPVSAGTSIEQLESRGTFLKASFGFKNLLYLDGSYRFDWSSTADPDNNRVETYGVSTSLLVNKLLPQNNIMTFFKVRAGYAKAPYFPNPYQISSVYNVNGLYQGQGTLSVASRQNNPNLVGGTRGEFEVGAEFRFIKSRIGLDVTYFKRIDEDLPVEVNLDGSTGYGDIIVNSGKNTSTGIEIGLNGSIIKTDDFTWDLGVNFATLEKFVDAIYPGVDSYDISTYTSSMKLQARVGEEYGLFLGRGFANHTDGSIIYTGTDQFARESNKKLGSLLPDYTYGITSTIRYKNLDLFVGLDGQKGGLYYSRTERYMDHSGLSAKTAGLNDKGNPLRDPVASGGGVHIVGVLQTGTDADGVPISDGTIVDKYVDAQDHFNLGNLGNIYENNVHDATYLKLRTARLNYNFNSDLVSKMGLEALQLSVFGNNLWLIDSDLNWVDPSEIEKRSGVNWAEAGQLPITRSFGLNVKLTF